ncbi:MAG: two-component system, OmpR family, sensor histidine kinase KdpD [Acidimicrobiaceae bacterium]|nr:two-component system, OmpR family, sensor histidine kinase KdpD [Acidimicrobiaceae bacterium]
MPRGTLRVYLGAAPGVGKTYAMLCEGRRRHSRGTDVVVGLVETHGRAVTQAQIGDLEVVPRTTVIYRDSRFEEMDVDAVIARRPELALVDELAHTNVPGARHEKRWQDVERILAAGIDVISTVNIQHLESVNDVVERITGIVQRETIPDAVVRAADQIELVDMSPEALRRRMAHGNIYDPDKIDAALSNYFRPGNLAALRELALLWVADRVEDSLQQYMADHGITRPWETRERVVVALSGAPGGDALIRRASRMAQRTKGELLGVHVRSDDGLAGPPTSQLAEHQELLDQLGGSFHQTIAADPTTGLLSFARAEHATQLVLGHSQRSRCAHLGRGSVVSRVIRQSGDIDVHVISTRSERSEEIRLPTHRRLSAVNLPRHRQVLGWSITAVGLPALTLALAHLRSDVTLSGDLLLYLALVVGVSAAGGTWPALGAAIAADLLANWFFIPPLHTFAIGDTDNVVALVVFLAVAGLVSWLVGYAARRSTEATRGRAEAATLVRLAGALLSDDDPLVEVVGQLRATFGFDGVSVLRREGDRRDEHEAAAWHSLAAAGDKAPDQPDQATDTVVVDADTVVAIAGVNLSGDDRRVLGAFTAQLAVALRSRALQADAATAAALSQANDLRTALLRAVSHDLRTPLASIKASATNLLADDIRLAPEAIHELLATIDGEADRLDNLIANLLDMSRLQSGTFELVTRDVGVDEIVAQILAGLGERATRVVTEVPENLPRIHTDAALLERAVANVIENAICWSPPDKAVRVQASAFGGLVELRVVDRGPGIRSGQREQVFQPFQRLGDDHAGTGVGLGLAVARGFVDALGGELTIDDTAGGGTTMTFAFKAAPGGC